MSNYQKDKSSNIRSVYNVGYLGVGKYLNVENGKNTYVYCVWNGMLRRCYSKEYLKKFPSYIGCTVHEDWHNFQNFAKWFDQNYIKGCQLDKDILIKGNKVYSSGTCCFVPQEINSLLTNSKNKRGNYLIGVRKNKSGKYSSYISFNKKQIHLGTFDYEIEAFLKYKKEKENIIKEQSSKYFKDGKINMNVHMALYHYKINITD